MATTCNKNDYCIFESKHKNYHSMIIPLSLYYKGSNIYPQNEWKKAYYLQLND